MQEEKSIGADINKGLGSIFERLGEFFHIFDLSFFVAGSMTFSALAFIYIKMSLPYWFPFEKWACIFAFIIGSYVCGLISFAVGRCLNDLLFRRQCFNKILRKALSGHGLTDPVIMSYTNQESEEMLGYLYTRMWFEIVHEKSDSPVLQHLMRYWAMSATYDGLGFSLIVWALVIFAVQFNQITPYPINQGVAIFGGLLAAITAVIAFRQAAIYYEYQIKDLVAHFVVMLYGLTRKANLNAPAQ